MVKRENGTNFSKKTKVCENVNTILSPILFFFLTKSIWFQNFFEVEFFIYLLYNLYIDLFFIF